MDDELSDSEQEEKVCITSSLSAEHKDKEALMIEKQLLPAQIETSAVQRRLRCVAGTGKQSEKREILALKDCILAVREKALLLYAEMLESSNPDGVLEAKAERL